MNTEMTIMLPEEFIAALNEEAKKMGESLQIAAGKILTQAVTHTASTAKSTAA